MSFGHKNLFGLRDLSADEILYLLDEAKAFRQILERDIKKVPTLRWLAVVNLFYEPSTRTRISFELAEKRLSAEVVNFSKSGSSVAKGESLRDTVNNILAMKVDMVVVRHSSVGAPQFIHRATGVPVINAGDGTNEHPTQALLDLYTIREKFGQFNGLKVVILGDIRHSRVARSNIWGLKKLGAKVVLCGPKTLLPPDPDVFGVEYTTDIEEALAGAQVVNVLRLQLERQQSGFIPSLREYRMFWGLTAERKRLLDPDHIIMHPGPLNRGVEIDPDVADDTDAVILEQVTNGVAVRMAVLYTLAQKLREA
ncbi:aspartate carbamoyltransferase catalytic subunit [bacterium]|nr:aspartate carbamoyltransferase catalytic subunit [bacterium]